MAERAVKPAHDSARCRKDTQNLKRWKSPSRPHDDARICPRRRGPQQGYQDAHQPESALHGLALLPKLQACSFTARGGDLARSFKLSGRVPQKKSCKRVVSPCHFIRTRRKVIFLEGWQHRQVSTLFPRQYLDWQAQPPPRRQIAKGRSCEGQSSSSHPVRAKMKCKNRRKNL